MHIITTVDDDSLVSMDDGYYLAFRLTAHIGRSAYDKYTAIGVNDDSDSLVFDNVPCGCKTTDGRLYCDRHYRSKLLDLWKNLPIDKVRTISLMFYGSWDSSVG